METRTFGTSDISSSVLGFGTWPIGGARYGKSDDEDAIRAIEAAFDLGVTCFDTAPSYGAGHAEEVLGRALAGKRHQAFIATKGGMVFDDKSFIQGQNANFDFLAFELEKSLSRLRTDYIDLYIIHWPDPDTPIDEIAGNLDRIVDTGKARAAGVSNCTAAQIDAFVAGMPEHPLVASQVGYSLFDRRWADETFETCQRHGIGVMAYGPLAHGLLTGTLSRDDTFDETDWRFAGVIFGQPLLTQENRDANFKVIERLKEHAADGRSSLPQMAIAWTLANDAVTVSLIGARNEAEIREAVAATDIDLDQGDLDAIADIMQDARGMTDTLPAGGTSKATQTTGDA